MTSTNENNGRFSKVSKSKEVKFEDCYVTKEALGSGRFGKVSLIEEKETGKKYAGKHCLCRRASQRKDLELEIEIMKELDHPKLLKLYDVFFGPRDVMLVLELVTGGELFERVVDDNFDLTEELAVVYLRQICEGIAHMHSLSILHLDIKPENILCLSPDNVDIIKIIDFGFSRRYSADSSLKVMFGTPEFVAPEVVNYEPLGKGSDVWSVGVITYILLSGLSPFMGDDDQETLSNVTACEVDFDDECFDDVTDDAKDFIKSLLVKKESDRPSCNDCLNHRWLCEQTHERSKPYRKSLYAAVTNLKKYVCRRKWLRIIHTVIAMNRLQAGGKKHSLKVNSAQTKNPRNGIENDKFKIQIEDEQKISANGLHIKHYEVNNNEIGNLAISEQV